MAVRRVHCASAGLSSARWVIGSGRAEHLASPKLGAYTPAPSTRSSFATLSTSLTPCRGQRTECRYAQTKFTEGQSKSLEPAVLSRVKCRNWAAHGLE